MQSGDLILDLGSNGQDFWEVLAAAEVDAGRGGARRSLAGGLEHSELSPSHGQRRGPKRVARSTKWGVSQRRPCFEDLILV